DRPDLATRTRRVHRYLLRRAGLGPARHAGRDCPDGRRASGAAQRALTSVRALVVCLALLVAAPAAHAQDPRTADWLRTVRDSALWSGSADPSVQFTVLPLGSF